MRKVLFPERRAACGRKSQGRAPDIRFLGHSVCFTVKILLRGQRNGDSPLAPEGSPARRGEGSQTVRIIARDSAMTYRC